MRPLKTLTLLFFALVSVNSFAQSYNVTVEEVELKKAAIAGNVNQARVIAEETTGSNWLVNGLSLIHI